MIGNNKDTATEGSQVVRVSSGGRQPHKFLTGTTCLYVLVVCTSKYLHILVICTTSIY